MKLKPKLPEYNIFSIQDYIQTQIDTSQSPFLKEIILLITMYLFYINVESNILTSALKYGFIIFLLRYILSILTRIQNIKTKDRYFQIDSNVVLFSIMIFLMMNSTNYLTWILISSYSLLVISTKEHYTSDIIITILVVHYILHNNYIKQYVQ